jgi:hypothetical protein
MILPAIIWIAWLNGCATKVYPVICMEDCIVSGLVAHREKIPYRLAVEQGKHCQSQWLIDGGWVWVHERDDMVVETQKDNFQPDKYFYDVKDYVNSRY